MKLKQLYKDVLNCDSGATAVEYGLIVSLIVIALITALTSFSNSTIGMWEKVENALASV